MTRKPVETDSKAIRNAVYAYFKIYRECRHELEATPKEEPQEQFQAKAGYENAIHPKRIRNSLVKTSSPVERALTSRTREERLTEFCVKLDNALRKMPEYQSEIIRRRFLVPLPAILPTDHEVWSVLCTTGWDMSEATYERQKQRAVSCLARALRVDKILGRAGSI